MDLLHRRKHYPIKDFPIDRRPDRQYEEIMWDKIKEHFGESEPEIAVEIGSRRAVWAADLMRHTKDTRLFCVDPWNGNKGRRHFYGWMENAKHYAYDRMFPLHGTSERWLPLFPYNIDLLYVDADHSYESVFFDLRNWGSIVRPGGLIIGHNWGNKEGVRQAAIAIFGEENLEIAYTGPHTASAFFYKKKPKEK